MKHYCKNNNSSLLLSDTDLLVILKKKIDFRLQSCHWKFRAASTKTMEIVVIPLNNSKGMYA